MELHDKDWQLVGEKSPATLTIENDGSTPIAYVIASEKPDASARLDKDNHFLIQPSGTPHRFTGMQKNGFSLFARSVKGTGKLAVFR